MTVTDHLKPHPPRCGRLLRQQAPQQGWSTLQLVNEIHEHCGHSRLRSHRLAHGWTLDRAAQEITSCTGAEQPLSPSRVCRWELDQDRPSTRYLDALCRVYRTSSVELGFGHDYGASHTDQAPPATGQPPATVHAPSQEEDMRHRDVLTSTLLAAGALVSLGLVDHASKLRQAMDETLAGSSLSDATIAHKETVANQYGRIYKTQPVQTFLSNILADFNEVQGLANRRLPSGQRHDLCAVVARMAGLVSMTMVNLGEYREAREWVHTARLAADEAGAPTLRAWVATRAAVAHLHFEDPDAAATAAHEAELLTRQQPSDVTAMAWAITARAAGLNREPQAARYALRRAEDLFGTGDPADNSAYVFKAAQLHFYASHALTSIGETRAAWEAQDAALAAFGPDEMLDPTLVHLDRAFCIVQDGDTVAGADYAAKVLLELPTEYRPSIVLRRATAIADAVPPRQRTLPAVRRFHDVLALGTGTSTNHPLPSM